MGNIKSGSIIGYVQCDMGLPEKLRETFANFIPIFQNNKVGRGDIGPFMTENAEKEGILTHRRKMLR